MREAYSGEGCSEAAKLTSCSLSSVTRKAERVKHSPCAGLAVYHSLHMRAPLTIGPPVPLKAEHT